MFFCHLSGWNWFLWWLVKMMSWGLYSPLYSHCLLQIVRKNRESRSKPTRIQWNDRGIGGGFHNCWIPKGFILKNPIWKWMMTILPHVWTPALDQVLLNLVIEPPLWKNMISSVGMIRHPIYGRIQHVPNHQPVQHARFRTVEISLSIALDKKLN